MEISQRAQNISASPTLAIDAKAKQMIADGKKVINFGAGEPDFDTPEHIKKAAVEALKEGATKYTPVAGIPSLKKAIIEKFSMDNGLDYESDQIVVSCGAKHSLYNAFMILCQQGDEVLLPAPYWVSYLEQIKLAGATPVAIKTREENGFKVTPEELQQAITSKTRLIILNSPGNPTGAVYTRDELSALAEVLVKNNVYIISDEIYEKLVYDGQEHISIAALDTQVKDCTVVINGMSKSYSMTGWRIGYTAAPHNVARSMANLQSHSTSNPTSIAQAGARAAITGSQAPLENMLEQFAERRKYMVESLKSMPGISCNIPGGAFYVFPNIKDLIGKSFNDKTIQNASDFASLALDEIQVAMVPGIAFGENECFRLSYATSMNSIEEGLNRLRRLLDKLQ
ncbi:MAG: pyridoxal phosphate-dependent aminotransferase [Clostridiales bacterium]|nr:pyridoxal phosphate-dependent aminotransferase [Clostridiales bacterium]MCF8022726.1 pyridoxal phosphate-dependent aminotransferase [Clostridiales bacterium]